MQLAEHALLGYSLADGGYSIEELCSTIGLTKKEWETIKQKGENEIIVEKFGEGIDADFAKEQGEK